MEFRRLAHLAPTLTLPMASALDGALYAVKSDVDVNVREARYSFARYIERLTIAEWVDVFVVRGVVHPVVVVTTPWWVPLTKLHQIGAFPNEASLTLLPLARAAATTHHEKIDRLMLFGDAAAGVRGFCDLLTTPSSWWFNATPEVVRQEADRRKSSGDTAGWETARAVFAIELEQLPPQWTRDGGSGEPCLEFLLLSRVAGVVPGAVK